MHYNFNSRFPQPRDPRLWLILALLLLSTGFTIAGYSFDVFVDVGFVQVRMKGEPSRTLPPPVPDSQPKQIQ